MEIIIDNFKIEKLKDIPFYDLSELTIVNEGKETEREEYKTISYGVPFDTCIEQIVDYQMRNIEGVYSVKEYIDLYEEKVFEIAKHFE